MDDSTRHALKCIEEAVAWKPPEGPMVLSEEYLRLIEQAERLPQNCRGADKTWTERVLSDWKKLLKTVRRVPRK